MERRVVSATAEILTNTELYTAVCRASVRATVLNETLELRSCLLQMRDQLTIANEVSCSPKKMQMKVELNEAEV